MHKSSERRATGVPRPGRATAPVVHGAPLRLLLADDHPMVREGLLRVLESQPGVQVVAEASNGTETVRCARETAADLLLLDLSMPEPNGVTLIGAVRRASPALPILVLSMHDKPMVVRAALDAGASGYITKGSDIAVLMDAVRHVAAGHPYVEPRLMNSALLGRGAGTPVPRARLSGREMQVLERLVQGQANHEIAQALFLSEKTISSHKASLMRKLGVSSLVDLPRAAERYLIDRAGDDLADTLI